MIQEEKQLLLKDLCARLPYGIKICVGGYICTLFDINTEMGDKLNGKTFHTVGFNKPDGNYDFCAMTEVKPYIRSMSSMTEGEKEEYEMLQVYPGFKTNHTDLTDMYDWLNEKMFDYRGLIEKGLAVDSSGLNIY